MAACGLQCPMQIMLQAEHCFRYQMEVKQRKKTGEEEHVSGLTVSHLWWESKVFPSVHSCTSKQMPVSLFHFAGGYEPPGRLWDPPGVRREDSVRAGTLCFPPHIHGPGQRQVLFSIGPQPQIKISVVVYENKSDETCCSTFKGLQSANWSMSSQNFYCGIFDQSLNFLSWLKFETHKLKLALESFYLLSCAFLVLLKLWNCRISNLLCRKDLVSSILSLLIAKIICFSQQSKPSAQDSQLGFKSLWLHPSVKYPC